jgi:hypothetical protein
MSTAILSPPPFIFRCSIKLEQRQSRHSTLRRLLLPYSYTLQNQLFSTFTSGQFCTETVLPLWLWSFSNGVENCIRNFQRVQIHPPRRSVSPLISRTLMTFDHNATVQRARISPSLVEFPLLLSWRLTSCCSSLPLPWDSRTERTDTLRKRGVHTVSFLLIII